RGDPVGAARREPGAAGVRGVPEAGQPRHPRARRRRHRRAGRGSVRRRVPVQRRMITSFPGSAWGRKPPGPAWRGRHPRAAEPRGMPSQAEPGSEKERTDPMKRYLPLTAAALVLFSGVVHGLWTDRWAISDEPGASAAKLDDVPMTI